MTEEVLRSAFDPFFTTKDVGKGTGLGLSMVAGLISQMNGNIIASSTLGEGTTIELFLPLVDIGDSISMDDLSSPLTIATPLSILVVEDESELANTLCEYFTAEGHKVRSVGSGNEALQLLSEPGTESRFDALLADMRTPGGITGTEDGIRLRTINPMARIVIMSGHTEENVGSGNLPHGTVFLPKPFRLSELHTAIRSENDA
jgi:CheY-like chemotaxis protein